jgi:hypothetical protein
MPLPPASPAEHPHADPAPLRHAPAGGSEAARHAQLLRTGCIAAGPGAEPPRRAAEGFERR